MQEWHHSLYNPITRRFPWRLTVMWPELSCSSERGKSVSNNQINNPLETVSTTTAGTETSCWSESDPGSDVWVSELTIRGECRTRTRTRTARIRLSSVLIRPAEFTWLPDRRGRGLIQLGWERATCSSAATNLQVSSPQESEISFYSAEKKYSHPWDFCTFCHVQTSFIGFMWHKHKIRCIGLKWKSNYMQFI